MCPGEGTLEYLCIKLRDHCPRNGWRHGDTVCSFAGAEEPGEAGLDRPGRVGQFVSTA